MKSLSMYISEALSGIRLDGMKGYGVTCSPGEFVITGAGSIASRETYLKSVIENVPFNPSDIQDALNNDGCTYSTWKADVKNCDERRVILRTNDKYGNLITLTVYKN